MRKQGSLATLLLLAVSAAACGGDGESKAEAAAASPSTVAAAPVPAPPPAAPFTVPDTINPTEFRPHVTHPLFPLYSLRRLEFSGTERDTETGKTVKTRTVKRLLHKTEVVAGVTVAVLEVKDYEDGELVEVTEDYFAEHRNGSVWSFGERVSDYENGKVVGHEGQWLAGQGNNKPGLYLPTRPMVGQEFEPERAPGVAEVRSKVVQLDAEVTVPAGKYTGCLKTEDFSVLDKVTELSFYCPGAGLVRSEGPHGTAQLVRIS
ncbi:MAG: hypothetical protein ACRDYF_19870 [Acidimicrobiia bacterium]